MSNWKKGLPCIMSIFMTGLLLGNTVAMAAESTSMTPSKSDDASRTTTTATLPTSDHNLGDTGEKTKCLSGQLTWNDQQNKVGYRPDNVLVTLLKDGKETSYLALASKDHDWRYQFDNVPLDKSAQYSVKVEALNGYETKVSGLNITCTLPFFNVPISIPKGEHFTLKALDKTITTLEDSQTVSLPKGDYTLEDDQQMGSFQVGDKGQLKQWLNGDWQTVEKITVKKAEEKDSSTATSTTKSRPAASETTSIAKDWGDHDLIALLLSRDATTSTTTNNPATTPRSATKNNAQKAEKTTATTNAKTQATKDSDAGGAAVVEQRASAAISRWIHGREKMDIQGSVSWKSPLSSYQPTFAWVILKRDGHIYRATEVDAKNQWKYQFNGVPKTGIFHKEPYHYTVSIQFKNQDYYQVTTSLQHIQCVLPVKQVAGVIHWQDDTAKYRALNPVLKSGRRIVSWHPTMKKEAQQWLYSFEVPQQFRGQAIPYQVDFPNILGYQKRVDGNNVTYTLRTKAVRFHCLNAQTRQSVQPLTFWLEDETDSIPKLLPNTLDNQYYLRVGHIYRVRSSAIGYQQEPLEIRINPQTYQVEYKEQGVWQPLDGTTIPVYYTKKVIPGLPNVTLPNGPSFKPDLSHLGGLASQIAAARHRLQNLASLLNHPILTNGLNLPTLPHLPKGNLPALSLPNFSSLNQALDHPGTLPNLPLDTLHQNAPVLKSALPLPQTGHQREGGLIIAGCALLIVALTLAILYWKRH